MDLIDNFKLSDKEQLQLHQLEIARYWYNKNCEKKTTEETTDLQLQKKVPRKWNLTKDIELHSWQKECVEHFCERGIAKVVTGAGKTIMALALIQKIQNEINSNLKVLIIVPTIVLLNQWYATIMKYGNLPDFSVGRLGGGFEDDLNEKSVLIGVCNSVAAKTEAWSNQFENNLMLIADECHRYNGNVMRKVFFVKRKYSLGLSATPDVDNSLLPIDENDNNTEENSNLDNNSVQTAKSQNSALLKDELGDVFYQLSYDEAVKAGFLPEFEIRHIGLPLTCEEQQNYDKLSREITDCRDRIFDCFPKAPHGGDLSGWAQKMLSSNTSHQDEFYGVLSLYVSKVSKRKSLIYQAKNREIALVQIIKEQLKQNKKAQFILFHERIDEVMRLYDILKRNKVNVVPEHSELPDSLREKSIELFRAGKVNVIISGKALIEGFDAPAADVGINVASSGSKTKAIQSIGRILRKNIENEEKTGLIIRFYISNTIDAFMFRKTDFNTITGARRNRYFLWNPQNKDENIFGIEQSAPPFTPLPKENSLDFSVIKPGTTLNFEADGDDFQIDNNNNIYVKADNTVKYAKNPQTLLEIIEPFRENMRNNYIRQTSSNRIFLRVCDSQEDNWSWLFCGQLNEKLVFENKVEQEAFIVKQWSGHYIIQEKKGMNGHTRNIPDKNAQIIFNELKKMGKQENEIKNIYIKNKREVFYRENSEEKALCVLTCDWNA